MDSPVAIRVENVSKAYRIWESPAARLTSPVLRAAGRLCPASSRMKSWFQARAASPYRDFQALQQVTFEVSRGECLGIIGRNGSGKSTLLQIIAGTMQATEGTVQVNGRVAALLELGSGFNPEFTGRENVYLTANVLGLTKKEVDACFDDIAAFADIGAFLEEPIKTYSSGMTLRLAFAVVAHVKAEIMIVDEALAVGDVFFVQKCMRFLRAFRETGTLLFVTHNVADINALCNRAVWLNAGRMELLGEAKTVSERYLEHFHAAAAALEGAAVKSQPGAGPGHAAGAGPTRTATEPAGDQRLPYLNTTQYRNDLRLIDFNPDQPSFGTGQAHITDVWFSDRDGRKLAWLVGGEDVILHITASASEDLHDPILGFYLKNRLGQYIFGDNTYLTNKDAKLFVPKGGGITARFAFRMPLLPEGPYAVAPAVAVGTYDNHVQQHWIHEGLIIESISKQPNRGLVGLPMSRIETEIVAAAISSSV
jgi:lipopolysaccharide transport system ATP-binding protein